MNIHYPPAELEAFRLTADVVAREAEHLAGTHRRLFAEAIDRAWVLSLEQDVVLAERVEAFVSRFGRLQDTLADKFLPRMAALAGHRPAPLVELLAAAEKYGWIQNADRWLVWRKLRNRLVHEYVTDPAEFALALNTANQATVELLAEERRLRESAVRLALLEGRESRP